MSGGENEAKDITEEAASIPEEHAIDTLRAAQEEARTVLDHQIQNFTDVDNKAAKTFRLDALLLGLLLTGVSFVYQADALAIEAYANPLTIFAILLLIFSFIMAVVTYTVTSIETGMGADDIERLLEQRYTELEWLILLLRSEAVWMRRNTLQNQKGARLLSISHGALILGVVFLFAGIAVVHL